jgi:hypothetical protein
MRYKSGLLIVAALWFTNSARLAIGAIAIEQIGDINNGGVAFGGAVNVFASAAGAPFQVDETAVFMNNDIVVYTMNGISANDGAGLAIGISNGENGITSTAGGTNLDPDNTEPVDPVFTTIGNSTGKLENGNVIRFSLWMRQDPSSPVTVQPQIEPVVKIELWKQALSGLADFSNVPFPGSGDRIWDTDQNAGNAAFNSANQSRASWVDVNNNGVIGTGQPVAASLVTDEWRLVEATLVVDDDPLDDGLGWSIGTEFFTVADVEEIRAVMFVGDFAGTNLTNAGSFWVDNLMLEVFADEAALLATPNPNTAPVEVAGLPGDYNENDVVDAADYTVWRDRLGQTAALPNDDTEGVGMDDYTRWKNNFGMTLMVGAGSLGTISVPEPSTFFLACGGLLLLGIRSSRRCPTTP